MPQWLLKNRYRNISCPIRHVCFPEGACVVFRLGYQIEHSMLQYVPKEWAAVNLLHFSMRERNNVTHYV